MSLTQDFDNAKKQYFRERLPDEIDLIEEVRGCLVQAGLHDQVSTAYDQDVNIQNAKRRNAAVQRFVLNRFWTSQLYCTVENTEHLRRLLFPEGDIHRWLHAFRSEIMPFIVRNNLPLVI